MWQLFLDFYKTNSAFASTVLGIVIAVLTFFLRERHNRKRILRKVLYHLLNLYWSQGRLLGIEKTLKTEITRFIQQLSNEFSQPVSKEEIQQALVQYDSTLDSILELTQAHFSYPPEEFLKDLDQLSNDYPLLAYRLRDVEKIANLHMDLFAHLKQSFSELGDLSPASLLDGSKLLSEDPLYDLKTHIHATARKAGPWTYLIVRFKTLPKARPPSSDSNAEFKTQFDELKSHILVTLKAKLAKGTNGESS